MVTIPKWVVYDMVLPPLYTPMVSPFFIVKFSNEITISHYIPMIFPRYMAGWWFQPR